MQTKKDEVVVDIVPGAEASISMMQKGLVLSSLVFIQIVVAVSTKLAVSKGGSDFSSASMFIITEAFKFFLAWGTFAAKQSAEVSWLQAVAAGLAELRRNFTSFLVPYGVLAFAYAFNNNLSVYVYNLADVTSLAMIRCGTVVVSALISMPLLGRRYSAIAWISMLSLTASILIAQVDACEGSAKFRAPVYALLMVNMSVSCLAAVWNEKLVKGLRSPLEVQQMSLYGFGLVLQVATYLVVPRDGDAGFLSGWGFWTIVMALCNAFMGLVVITALKYGDSVLKAMSTPIKVLLISVIDWVFLGNDITIIGWLSIIPVVSGSYLYVLETSKKS